MSEWFEIKDPDDVDLSDDGNFVHVLFETNRNGNRYVEIPVSVVNRALGRCKDCDGKGWFGSQFCEGEECPTCEGTGKADK